MTDPCRSFISSVDSSSKSPNELSLSSHRLPPSSSVSTTSITYRPMSNPDPDQIMVSGLIVSIQLQNQLLFDCLNKTRRLRYQLRKTARRHALEDLYDYGTSLKRSIPDVQSNELDHHASDNLESKAEPVPVANNSDEIKQERPGIPDTRDDIRQPQLINTTKSTNIESAAPVSLYDLLDDVLISSDPLLSDPVLSPLTEPNDDSPVDIDILGQINNLNSSLVDRPAGWRLFRSAVQAVRFCSRLSQRLHLRHRLQRETRIKEFNDILEIYMDMTRAWFLPALRHPVMSLLSHPDLDFAQVVRSSRSSFMSKLLSRSQSSNILTQILVRIKHILDRLISMVQVSEKIPNPLMQFIQRYLLSSDNYFPEDYLTSAERVLLQFNYHSATVPLTEAAKTAITTCFLISRVLVSMILEPWRYGLGKKPDQANVIENFRILASIMYESSCFVISPNEDPGELRLRYTLLQVDHGIYHAAEPVIRDAEKRIQTFIEILLKNLPN